VADGLGSTAVGNASMADGVNSTAAGANSQALGNSSTATGAGSFAAGANSSAFGAGAQALQAGATAIGQGAVASGDPATALGMLATASGNNSVALGANSLASGNASSAIGQSAIASGDFSVALGQGANAGFANSIAIGQGVATTRANQVMLGNGANTYTLPGIASAASKAAQTGQLQFVTADANGNLATTNLPAGFDPGALTNSINGLQTQVSGLAALVRRDASRASGGIAEAAALGGAVIPAQGHSYVGASAATYNGHGGIAASIVHHVDGTGLILSAGVALGTGGSKPIGRVAAGFEF
jgi:trimeric autotransporter adhesin